MRILSYSECVEDAQAYVPVTLDLAEPIELTDFAELFASLAKQFNEYLAANHPNLAGDARIFVKEIRHGSIIADLVPLMTGLVDVMDKTLIVQQFSKLVADRIALYVRGQRLPDAKKSDLAHVTDLVKAVAKNKAGQAQITSVEYVGGKEVTALRMSFDVTEARKAIETLEAHKVDLDKRQSADVENVLMVFFQANLKDAEAGKRSGEQVIIESLGANPKPLVYASDLAKERIKAEFGDAIFRKGFYVDVNVETLGGRTVAYKVTNVRQVIDLPD